MPNPLLYLDSASTSYPKSPAVLDLLAHFYDQPVGSYGRSADERTLGFITEVERLRDDLARLIGARGIDAGSHVVFTKNATEAINMVLSGLPGLLRHRVLISPMEHNAVTRPLHHLPGGMYTVMPSCPGGVVDMEALEKMLCTMPPFDLMVLNAMSNVTGLIPPIADLCALIHRHTPDCRILIDAAQYLPHHHLHVEEWGIDYVAMTGHKGFGGLPGTGALYISDGGSVSPLMRGGNGVHSEVQEDVELLPDRFEAGTLNLLGLVAWARAYRTLPDHTLSADTLHDWICDLSAIPSLHLHHGGEGYLFSLTSDTLSVARLHDTLLHRHGILTRAGIHCAPLAHHTLGTLPEGTLRIALSPHTDMQDLETLTQALHSILH